MKTALKSCTRQAVLLEGAIDVAAVRAVMSAQQISGDGVELVSLEGVTNIAKVMAELRQVRSDVDVVGMCDAAESRFVEKALADDGLPVSDASDLPAYGFFVCERDLEDELIRALGAERARDALLGAGLAGRFDALRQQPEWIDRPLAEQVRRFCGSTSGRKELAASLLARELGADEVPEPLAMLLDRIRWA